MWSLVLGEGGRGEVELLLPYGGMTVDACPITVPYERTLKDTYLTVCGFRDRGLSEGCFSCNTYLKVESQVK